MDEGNRDYLAAFAMGAIVGIGATLLLTPDEPSGAKRLLHEIEPALSRARKSTRRFGKQVKSRARRGAKRTRRNLFDWR